MSELTRHHLQGVAMRVLGRRDLGKAVLQEVYVAVWQLCAQLPGVGRQPHDLADCDGAAPRD